MSMALREDTQMNVRQYVEDLQLSSGATHRGPCPSCRGHNTFTASNADGMLFWNCYKHGCNLRGGTATKLSLSDIQLRLKAAATTTATQRMAEPPAFAKPHHVRHISRHDPAYNVAAGWAAEWGLDIDDYMYDFQERRVVFPVYHEGMLVDAAGRAIGYSKPKWKRYGNSRLPFTRGTGSVAVVVEDCISAAVIGCDGRVGVAILGTSLSLEHKKVLANFKRIIVALDPDARNKTLAYTRELSSVAPEVYALNLKDDLKYQNTRDIEGLDNLSWKKNYSDL